MLNELKYAVRLGKNSVINEKIAADEWIAWLFWNEVCMVSKDYKYV